jgi:dCMP deaminase
MKISHSQYSKIAMIISLSSRAERNKVGAIVVSEDDNIIAVGYNGTPSGFDNACEDLNGKTKREVLHAESNAIAKCARGISSTEGCTLYTTLSPCFDCAKMIIQCGIKRVFYLESYRDKSGIILLQEAGVECSQTYYI